MNSNRVISIVLILSIAALLFSGCGGGNPVTPPPIEPDDSNIPEPTEVISQKIDLSVGGEVEVTDPESIINGVKLIIPPMPSKKGRGKSIATITISYIDDPFSWELPDNRGFLLPPVVINSDVTLDYECILEIPYTEDDLSNMGLSSNENIIIYHYNYMSSSWEEVATNKRSYKGDIDIDYMREEKLINRLYPPFGLDWMPVKDTDFIFVCSYPGDPLPSNLGLPQPGDLLYKLSEYKVNEGWIPGHVGIYVGEFEKDSEGKPYNVIEALLSGGVQRNYYNPISGFSGSATYKGANQPMEFGPLTSVQRKYIVNYVESLVDLPYAIGQSIGVLFGMLRGDLVKGDHGTFNCVGLAEAAYELPLINGGKGLVSDKDEGNTCLSIYLYSFPSCALTPVEQFRKTEPAEGYIVSGQVTDSQGGGIADVILNFELVTFNDNYSDSFDEVKSDSKGKWSNSTSYNHKKLGQEWNITPQKDGYTFEPSALHEGWEKSDPSTWIVKKNANNINFTGIYDEPNHSPVIFELTADPPSVDINQTTTITCTASDPDDDDALTYTWTKTGGTFEGSITGPTITWRAPSTSDTYTVVCGVSDGNGGEATKSVGIPVSNITPTNQAPHIPNNPSPTDNSLGVLVNTDLGWTGGDPDPEDTVTYDVYFEANDSTPDLTASNNQSNTTYNPGTLNYNTHYYWEIIAKDNHGNETPGPVWNFTTESQINNPPNIPDAPSGPSSGKIGTSYSFSTSTIDPNEDNIAYKFDWGDGNISNWTSYISSGDIVDQLHSYSTKGTYYIKAKAKDVNGAESLWSNSHKIIIDLEINKPVAPSKLSATTLSQNNISLVWQDNSNNETGFKIERKTGTTGTFVQIATIGASASTGSGVYYEDSGLTPGTTYCYKVRAYNSADNSLYSNENCTTTNPSAPLPSATTGSATNITSNSATLNGVVNPNGVATGAFFQWGTTVSYGNLTTSQVLGSGTSNVNISANLTGLSSNTTYHFRTVATNSAAGTTYGEDRGFKTCKKVTVDNTSGIGLKLHSSPDDDSSVVTGLIEGTQMSVIGGPVQADGYTWWNIKGVVGGISREGWSAVGEWLTPIVPQINSTVIVAYTGGNGLRLRDGASLYASIIITLPEGTQMTVFDGPMQKNGYNWWALKGYVSGIWRTGWSAVGNWLVPNPRD